MKCCICGKEFEGWGNNPAPILNGEDDRCCDECNWEHVIPERIKQAEITRFVNDVLDILEDGQILVVYQPADSKHDVKVIDNNLETLQDIVNGYIEVVNIGNGILLVCNEEGKIHQLKPNLVVGNDTIVGDVVFVADAGDDFGSLSAEQIIYINHFLKGGAKI